MKSKTLAASAILAAFLGSALASADTSTKPSPLALQYLARNLQADGSLDGSAGETEDFVFGSTASGYDPRTLKAASGRSVFDYLAARAGDGTATSSGNPAKTSAGKTGKLILSVLDGKLSPSSFGSPSPQNLVSLLCSTYDSGTGAYGAAASAFDQSLALMALTAAADASCPVPAKARAYLEGLQDADGGWGFGGGSDTNSTSLALMALAAMSDSTGRAKALSYLHGEQQAIKTGGFAFSSTSPGTADSDPDSDALVIPALVAAGEDPGVAAWTVSGKTALTDIQAFQDLKQADRGYGGYFYARGGAPDTFTTSEVPAGVSRRPFPIAPAYADGAALPAAVEPNPTPTPIPSPTSTPFSPPGMPGAGAGPQAACIAADASSHAALVVQHADGRSLSFCVGFGSASTNGEQILQLAHSSYGLQYTAIQYGSMGDAICQIDNEPATPAGGFNSNNCLGNSYWNLFVSRAGGPWVVSNKGAGQQTFADRDAEGFHFGSMPVPPPSPAGVCSAAAASPAAGTTPSSGPPANAPSHRPATANADSGSSPATAGAVSLASPETSPTVYTSTGPDGVTRRSSSLGAYTVDTSPVGWVAAAGAIVVIAALAAFQLIRRRKS